MMTDEKMAGEKRGRPDAFSGARDSADPMLFWAERDPMALWRGTLFMLLVLSPLVLFAPAGFIWLAFAALLARALNQRFFRFHLTARELRLRPAALLPTLKLKLADVASAVVVQDPEGMPLPLARSSGHLLITTSGGKQLLVPALKHVAEAAEAVARLKRAASEGADETLPKAA